MTKKYNYKEKENGKNATGRPLLFDNEKELENKIKEYFDYCDKGKTKQVASKGVEGVVNTITVTIPYTVTGLASYLGTNRQTLVNYEEKEKFFDIIKKAKEKIIADMEERALMGDSNPTMTIFSLKNNDGRKDKHEIEQTIKVIGEDELEE